MTLVPMIYEQYYGVDEFTLLDQPRTSDWKVDYAPPSVSRASEAPYVAL